MTPPSMPATVTILEINMTINTTGHQVWTVNSSSFRGDYNAPLLLLANEKNISYPLDPEWNVYDFGSNGSFRLVVNNDSPFSSRLSHPMHMHGHNFFVVAEGNGRWDGQTIVKPQNPQRRDTQMLRRAGYVVLDLIADNPGVWAFHCHIAWHVSVGLYINIMERPADITEMQIPEVMKGTCVAWQAYTEEYVLDQIYSGL
ncbi:MAG: hypothetical protein M1818_004891 [Claussenomyces sp. TS43310]|nr:MAG: hypothetical protein M1818_004891 [Claussenomyces sp. TS43310]